MKHIRAEDIKGNQRAGYIGKRKTIMFNLSHKDSAVKFDFPAIW